MVVGLNQGLGLRFMVWGRFLACRLQDLRLRFVVSGLGFGGLCTRVGIIDPHLVHGSRFADQSCLGFIGFGV